MNTLVSTIATFNLSAGTTVRTISFWSTCSLNARCTGNTISTIRLQHFASRIWSLPIEAFCWFNRNRWFSKHNIRETVWHLHSQRQRPGGGSEHVSHQQLNHCQWLRGKCLLTICWQGRHYSDWALCAGAASCGRKCKCPQLQVWAANSLGATTISLHIVTITSGVFIPKSHPLWMETNLNPLNVMPSLLGHTKLILCCSSGARGQSVSARFLGFVWRLGVGYF